MAKKLLNYEVIDDRPLGEGAKSVIYKVLDPATRRILALKHVKRKTDKDIRFIEQMESEFEMSKNFNHPHIRRCFELKVNRTMLFKVTEAFLVMELVEGKPLDQALPRDMIGMLDVFLQTAGALQAMHKVGVVHCDIKPINIMMTGDSQVKVIDFGQSCKIGTIKDRVQGTPDYIAPEQVARKAVTPQTDVFNLGATMYWALTGRTIPTLYTVGKSGDNALLSHDLMQSPKQLNPTVSDPLDRLIMESIATQPAKRPPNMEAVIQRLELVKYSEMKKQGHVSTEPSVLAPDLYED